MTTEKEDRRNVIEGKCVRTSVSAMQKADGCLRQWRYRYVEGLPDKPPGKGQQRGIEGHKRIAHYLTTGEDVLAPLERLGLERGLIPQARGTAGRLSPGEHLLVEHPFGAGMNAGGIPMVGFVDLVSYRIEGRQAQITDWKFKKDISRWGASGEDLINPNMDAGIQMLGYAAWLTMSAPGPDQWEPIELRHVTFQTEKRADVVETSAVIDPKKVGYQIEHKWQEVTSRIVPRMRLAAAAPHAQEVEKNTELCERFGGCAYKSVCLDRMSRLVAGFKKLEQKEGSKMGLIDSMLGKTPAVPSSPLALTAKDAEQGKLYTVAGQQATFLCRVSTGGLSRASFVPLQGGAPILTALDMPISPAEVEAPKVEAPEVEAPKVETPKVEAPKVETPRRRMTYVDTEAVISVLPPDAPVSVPVPAVPPPPVDVPVSVPAPVVPPPADAPKKCRRPPGAKNAPAEAPVSTLVPVAPQEAPGGGINLYFGCAPVGVLAQTLGAYVETLDKQFREAAQLTCPDIRATSAQEFGFGKWRGFFAKLALEQLPPPGHYVVTSGDERVEVVAEALMGKAALVVLGGRR